MFIFTSPIQARHDPGGLRRAGDPGDGYYIDVPARVDLLRDALLTAGLGQVVPPLDFGPGPLEAVHEAPLLALLRDGYARVAAETGVARPVVPDTYWTGGRWERPTRTVFAELGARCYDTSAPLLPGTWEAAYAAAQGAVSAAAAVTSGEPLAYALCRPPGHHAGPARYGGFCYLNNAAIAAAWLAGRGRRVAILDVDYHHGNGTQAVFYARPDVLFVSLHADPRDEYPFYWGYPDETGEGDGRGTTLNLPLPLGTDGEGYLAALDRALKRVREHVAGEEGVLVLSLGFDAAAGDPTGTFTLRASDFRAMGRRLAALDLPIVAIQEGGYALDQLGGLAVAFFTGLTGKDG